ncbi:response regulator [Hymenobacter sp. 5516J-16]|uniref:Response regulator n=1 Tax=Hymenobacter sublimis TaxID=2933777 RepID=A0ABY4J788_9BACT|nr:MULTISPECIES: response regulator [Hymenobacter]UOQ78678.1 response regulator [Hymenobacter sp. 5516J-16]UPL48658.1 response regulator [Hymenobacter sublimis]
MTRLASVLLVDDDATTNFLNELLLRKLNVADKLLVALNGQEALELLHHHCQSATPTCPVLIFLDINMPVMDGFEFLNAYQQLAWMQQRHVIIVLLTTSMHSRDVAQAERLPVADYVSKPLNQEKVTSILRQHFPLASPEA